MSRATSEREGGRAEVRREKERETETERERAHDRETETERPVHSVVMT
jgi:hypothetical protein